MPGEQIAIDGKTLRHSYDKNSKQKSIIIVSAWARESGLVLAQRKVDKKSNEITAVPKLLKVLELKGAIVTLDAMGCQTKIVNQIISQKADYLITLKKNQDGLYKRVYELFQLALSQDKIDFESSNYSVFESGHGRTETFQPYMRASPLWEIVGEWKCYFYVTDGWKVYPQFIPDGDQIVSKTYMTRVQRRIVRRM